MKENAIIYKEKPTLYAFTRKGNKNAWLIYDENGKGEIIAILRVSKEQFWEKLGKGLNIKFIQGSP